MQALSKNSSSIQRLTALWALSESGLGGIMHAMKIPFTGFFLGGFAVVIISLIAYYTQNSIRQILQATLLVMLVKVAVSPHSPWPAYIAVGFQGLAGAIIYRLVPLYVLAAPLFGCIALLESALQKFILTTIIFGKSVWEAFDLFFQSILKDFSLPEDFSFSFWLIAIYTGVYAIWGIVLGIWIARLPKEITNRSDDIMNRFRSIHSTGVMEQTGTKKKNLKLLSTFFILLFIGSVFLFSGADKGLAKALYVVLRTVAILLFFFWVINPLLKWTLAQWSGQRKQDVQALIDQLPQLRNYIKPAYQLAGTSYTGWKKYKEFVFILIVVAMQTREDVPL